jgi:hypothetical protein
LNVHTQEGWHVVVKIDYKNVHSARAVNFSNVVVFILTHKHPILISIPNAYNQLNGNLGIKVIPSMSLLNTDQTPAVFWVTNPQNYILNNHGVAARRYGIWYSTYICVTMWMQSMHNFVSLHNYELILMQLTFILHL